jgi:hypothetical protein
MTRTHKETPKAAAAFSKYCAFGPERSLTRLAEQLWYELGAKGEKKKVDRE